MHTISAMEIEKTGFDSVLDRAEAGEETLITRHGRPVARLIPTPAVTPEAQAKARAALDSIRQRAASRKTGPFVWEEWKAYRDEGRR